jgi:hypothetical protein
MRNHRNPRITSLLRRASRRRSQRGAVLFVVAVTLALLAAMGVYGLSATAMDVRAAGHSREAMTGQNMAAHSFNLTAETFSPGAAQGIINTMYAGTGGTTKQSVNCRTAKPYTGIREFCDAEACVLLTPTELQNIAQSINMGVMPGPVMQPDSFGPNHPDGTPRVKLSGPTATGVPVNAPDIQIEVTAPITMPAPAGFEGPDPNNPKVFVQATVTVFTEVRRNAVSPPDINVIGRGNIIVGPMSKPPCVRP